MTATQPRSSPRSPGAMPVAPVDRWLAPLNQFLHIESASGLVLIACTVVALVLANSPLAVWFAGLWKTKVELSIGDLRLAGDIGHLVVSDGLMAIFFFVVGLEIKRELVVGELREPRKALLPVVAAAGGMVAPAVVYLVFQGGQPGQRGWAIPMATDIAFVVGVLALFGPKVPFPLKILLLSLAIVDDLGAVLIIAFVFSESLAWGWLAAAGAGLVVTYLLKRIGVRRVAVYVGVGGAIWFMILQSGMHPTVAGVLIGLLTPARAWVPQEALTAVVAEEATRLRAFRAGGNDLHADLARLEFAAREAISPLHRLETALHPWVAFVIMPVFALANAGVGLEVSRLNDPVALAVAAGLVVGKPLGILLFCWLGVRLGVTRLPDGVSWTLLAGGACLAGIGFTMALFITGLAFPVADFPDLEAAGKIGTLLGSLISALLGAAVLSASFRRQAG
jgi:Na+:H+ antiporter, NhaA family